LENWPNFFIVGAPKAGTTSLYEYLKNIPGIYMSPVKEPNYFCKKIIPENHPLLNSIRNKKDYLKLFDDVENEDVIGEASIHYLADPEAPELIQKISPNARILISLRDPVERAFSHYLFRKLTGWSLSSFEDQITMELNSTEKSYDPNHFLKYGIYSESVKRYLDYFGEKKIKIIIFEEFVKNKKLMLEEILRFLEKNHDINYLENKVHNPYRELRGSRIINYLRTNESQKKIIQKISPKTFRNTIKEKIFYKQQQKPEMNQRDREVLKNYYREDVEKLQNFLERKLPWPNF